MKRIVIFSFLVITALSYAQENTTRLNWLTDLEEAKKTAKKEKKNILLYFTGSDWCSPCKMLKEDFFNTAQFEERSKDMVLLLIDYPRRTDILTPEQLKYNKEIVLKYNTQKSFPNLLAMNSNGKTLDNISGYSYLRETQNHYAFLDKYFR